MPLSLDDARRLVEGYVEYCNNVRLNSAIAYTTPVLVGCEIFCVGALGTLLFASASAAGTATPVTSIL